MQLEEREVWRAPQAEYLHWEKVRMAQGSIT